MPTVLPSSSTPPSTATPATASTSAPALRRVWVNTAATTIGPMNSIATDLPRSVRAIAM